MRGDKWKAGVPLGKSMNGPDLIDAETMMRAIGALHSAHVFLTVSPNGTGSSGGVVTALTALFDVLPGSALPATVTTETIWPCKEHGDFWSHVFAGLYALDLEISKTYKNEALWKQA